MALDEIAPTRGQLLIGLALAELGRPSPEAVRLIRLALDMTGAELGQLLGVTPETISHWENGRTALPRPAWVTLASLAAEALGRPPSPAAWLRVAGDPPRAPRRLAIDATTPAARHLVWIVDPVDERRETLRFALLLRGVACEAFPSSIEPLAALRNVAARPDATIVVPGAEGASSYLQLANALVTAKPAASLVLVFGRESVILGPFANHPALWAGNVRPTDETVRRVLDALDKATAIAAT